MKTIVFTIIMVLTFASASGYSAANAQEPEKEVLCADQLMLLPDLVSVSPTQLSIIKDPAGGQRELWFNSTSANIGEGPLEMLGVYDAQRNQTQAIQRIKTDQGTYEERTAGYFIYHPTHQHWHFEEFTQLDIFPYSSAGPADEPIVTSDKISFCIFDMDKISPSVPGAPANAVYPECNPTIQGISVGWKDTYDALTPGQQIDIKDLPDGQYMLRMTVDPANRIVEKDEDNNSIEMYIEVNGADIRLVRS